MARGPEWPDGPTPPELVVLAALCRFIYATSDPPDLPLVRTAEDHVRWFSAFLHGAGPPAKPDGRRERQRRLALQYGEELLADDRRLEP